MEHDTYNHDTVRGRLLASLVGMTVLTLAMASFVRLPGRTLVVRFLGSDVSYEFSGAAQYTLLLVGIVCAGLAAILRADQRQALRLDEAAMFWGLPLFMALIGLLALDSLSWWGYQIALALLVGGAVALIVTLQMRAVTPTDRVARLALNGLVYAVALLVFAAIHGLRLRSLLSATAIFTTAAFLSAELFRDTETSVGRIWLWSGLVGLLLGELTWALNYTRLNTRAGAVVLLTGFYVLTGLIQQHLWQRLDRRAAIEFALALAIGVLVTLALA